MKEYAVQLWIYWELLQDESLEVPLLFEEAAAKYQPIAQFFIGPHAIHMQAQRDPDNKWFSTHYKLYDAELETIVNDWPTAWRELVSLEEVSTGPLVDAPVDPMHKDDQQSHHESNTESMETPIDPDS